MPMHMDIGPLYAHAYWDRAYKPMHVGTHVETQPGTGSHSRQHAQTKTHGKASTWGGRAQSAAPPPGDVGGLAVEDTHVPSETD